MKNQLLASLIIGILLAATYCLSLSAQSNKEVATVAEDGVTKTVIETPNGKLNVYLPDDMSDGDTISGTVIAEPAGNTEEEKHENEDVLSGCVVDIKPKAAKQEKTCKLSQPDFTCEIPQLCSAVVIAISDAHQKTYTSEVSCLSKPPTLNGDPNQPILPTHGTCGTPLKVKGKCDGKFDNSAILIGKKKCRMLAESPRQQVCLSPIDIVGVTQIETIEGPRHITGTFRNDPPAHQSQVTKAAGNGSNLSGAWAMTGTAEGHKDTLPVTVSQQGNNIIWQCLDTNYTGTLSGNTIQFTMSGTYWTGQGSLTVNSGGSMSGVCNYVYKSGRGGAQTMTIEMQR